MTADAKALRDQLQALTERVDALEARAETVSATVPDEETFWALAGLQSRLAGRNESGHGEVMLVGSLELPTGAPVSWQQSASTTGLIETDWSDYAAVFGALGHPVRLEILRNIVSGVHATAALADIDELGTTGQLHHHLRQLVAAGWVRQSGRGTYEIPAARVVPLLACLTGASR